MNESRRMAGLREILVGGECNSVSDWTILGNDTENLATTKNRVTGENAMEFDKVDGDDNSTVAGAYREVSWDLRHSMNPSDGIGMSVYVSDTEDVDYALIRIGASASHFVEYRFCASCLTAGRYTCVSKALASYDSLTGNGCDFANIEYVAVGVAFLAAGDALADIAIDNIFAFPGACQASNQGASLVVDGTTYQDQAGTSIISPDTDVSTTPVGLEIPAHAKFLYLRGNAAIRYGSNATLDGTDEDGYEYSPAYEITPPIPVLDRTAMYYRINASSGTCTVWFHFEERTE